MNRAKKHLWDIVLIGGCLLLAGLLFVFLRLGKGEGSEVVVKVGSQEIGRYSLAVDGVFVLNGGTNTLKIEDGKAWVIEADCPKPGGDVCTEHGKISKNGQMITCRPNKLTVTVIGGEDDGIDLIS